MNSETPTPATFPTAAPDSWLYDPSNILRALAFCVRTVTRQYGRGRMPSNTALEFGALEAGFRRAGISREQIEPALEALRGKFPCFHFETRFGLWQIRPAQGFCWNYKNGITPTADNTNWKL